MDEGFTSWEKLSNLKESHPIQVPEYTIAQGIQNEPAFNWWAHHVMKKRDRIISMLKQCRLGILKRPINFGSSCLRWSKRWLPLTTTVEIPSGEMPYRKKCIMWRSHSKSCLRVRSHPMGFSISTVTLCLTLKWKISAESHASWWVAIWPIDWMFLLCIALTMAVLYDLEVKAAEVLNTLWWHLIKNRYG